MAIPRNLSDLANQVDSSGTLGVAGGGTGLDTVGANGKILKSDGSVIFWGDALTTATLQSASGTSIDFNSIPSWVRRVTVMFDDVSTNGTSNPQIQLGTSSGIVTTGYETANGTLIASPTVGTASSGVVLRSANATNTMSGSAIFNLISPNVWVYQGTFGNFASAAIYFVAGKVDLGANLDRLRITTVNGTDSFDAGSINIMYE